MKLDFSVVCPYLPMFWDATVVTLKITASSLFFGVIISIPLSLCKISKNKILQGFAAVYTSIFRGIPLLVQVFMVAFGFPILTGIPFTAFQTGTIVFAMNSAAYISESLKGGIMSVDRGQWEAAKALGVGYGQTMKDIIFPQAIRSVLPSLINEFISLLKNTTLISTIGLVDILRVGQNVVSSTYRAFEAYLISSVFYFVLVMCFSLLGKGLERAVNKK